MHIKILRHFSKIEKAQTDDEMLSHPDISFHFLLKTKWPPLASLILCLDINTYLEKKNADSELPGKSQLSSISLPY